MASNSLLASIEYAKDFQYFGNENYPVKLIKAKITLTPVVGGKLIKFDLSAVTDQVIFGGEIIVSYLSVDGVEFGSQKFNLSDGVISLPISVGDFELKCCQVLSVDVAPGTYNLKMTLLNQDGRQLSCFAFDYTIPFDRTILYTLID